MLRISSGFILPEPKSSTFIEDEIKRDKEIQEMGEDAIKVEMERRLQAYFRRKKEREEIEKARLTIKFDLVGERLGSRRPIPLLTGIWQNNVRHLKALRKRNSSTLQPSA